MESSGWVAVRCIFRGQAEDPGEFVYEERVTLWRDTDVDRAIEKAEAEAETYASETTWPGRVSKYLGLAQAYALSDEPGDGAEVFSLMRTSDLPPAAYLDRFFDSGRERQGDVGGPAELA
ncbi:hypothetical protein [Kineococcus rhizosphaerae]|uniref:DUF4288 domain-containing protein n=1 Tax=Kineococcus rhizosphaerae TaxID=559628 RepID=A0A2T0R4U2_9ACTN|nr:hypothetical protein [Kineococcus rhizosphaerae]PRY15364.1 hypothetical protein CLV37_105292 [Kineococcus rhizosphaerae]